MRKDAREAVYKILFAGTFNQEIDDGFKQEIYAELKLKEEDKTFAEELLNVVTENYQSITENISNLSKGYNLERLYVADKCALLIGIAEIKYFDSVPNIVAIDEAVNLAKKYSTETSTTFVNGVLAEYKKITESEQ